MQETQQAILAVEDLQVVRDGNPVLTNLSFTLHEGENLAVVGPSGSGKTTLALALCSKIHFKGTISRNHPNATTAFVGQLHHFKNRSNTNDLYYQQRYNSFDADDAITSAEWIGINEKTPVNFLPGIEPLLSKPMVQLSNGEHKKVQLAKALLSKPDLLILDQPFIGLDTDSRKWLHQTLNQLAAQQISIILISIPSEIPDCISHVLQLDNNGTHTYLPISQWEDKHAAVAAHVLDDASFQQQLEEVLAKPSYDAFEFAIRMKNVQVTYGEKQVLKNIDWEVRRGESWLLNGANGAGKSTLLSLITADHPQAYANHIYLFDKRRGSGESIWDIKKKIGFVSPELHLYFEQTATCFETLASGLFDTIGLFRTLHQNDEILVNKWLQLFGFAQQKNRQLRSLSAGEQRLLLLARALIKNPPVLILDEPCQGLDEAQQQTMLRWIDEICTTGNKTLVFITHYQQDRPHCINRILTLENGAIIKNTTL